MGLDNNATRFLLYAKTQGVNFTKTAMIGRQKLHIDIRSLRKNLIDFGYFTRNDEVKRLLNERDGYAEPFLQMLGAAEIYSFDVNDYEDATNIHDFNLPIDEHLKNRFTVVLDVGSLEHVFNFPMAVKNCMEMVELGGHFLIITPTNNFFGHGFYQFSPELFFRIFNTINGFRLVRMILFEESLRVQWFEVIDPGAVEQRVTLVNTRPTYLAIIAKEVESVPIFITYPQQGYYVSLWESGDNTAESDSFLRAFGKFRKQIYKLVPNPLRIFYLYIHNQWKIFSRYSPKFFRKMRV